jgi:iron complex outermembrane receptor protein
LRVGGEYQQLPARRLVDRRQAPCMSPNTFWNVQRWRARADRDSSASGKRASSAALDDPRRCARVEQSQHGCRHGAWLRGYHPPDRAGSGEQQPSPRCGRLQRPTDRQKTDNNWDLTALATLHRQHRSQDIAFGFAHKTRSPNLHERYAWSTWQMAALMNNWVGDGNGYIGNLDLKPEQANTLSATFDWHAADRGWEFKATPYYSRVTDYIDAVQWNATTNTALAAPVTPAQFTVLKFMNQDARLYGLDLSGKMPLGTTGIGELGLKGLLNYTDGKNLDTGDGLYNVMPLNAKLALTHKLGGWDNAIELVMVKGKNDSSAVRNEIDTPGYSLLNLRGSYSWKQVRLDFGVENLFDKLYYLPNGGAYVGQGTTMTATPAPTGSVPAWGTAVPGQGRSIYAGLNVKF